MQIGGPCDPETFNINAIPQDNFFTWYPGSALTGLQGGDIIKFNDHAALVQFVGTPVTNSQVTHTSASWETYCNASVENGHCDG